MLVLEKVMARARRYATEGKMSTSGVDNANTQCLMKAVVDELNRELQKINFQIGLANGKSQAPQGDEDDT